MSQIVSNDSAEENKPSLPKEGIDGLTKRCLWRFLLGTFSSTSGIWLILEVSAYISKDTNVLESSGTLGFVIFGLIACIGGLTWTLVFLSRFLRRTMITPVLDTTDSPTDSQLSMTLIDEVRDAFESENWEEVTKIGSVLSRPLWVLGKYKLRVEVGRLVEAAAARSGKVEQQAVALIDDLGWTMFSLGDMPKAEENILHGIRLAETVQRFDLVAKGHRHLSGMALEAGRLQVSGKHLDEARAAANKISSATLSAEVMAGIQVNSALLTRQSGDHRKALSALLDAQKMYSQLDDHDRAVKLYHFIGDVQLTIGDVSAAKDTFRRGLTESQRSARRDGILKNTIGLLRIAKREGDQDSAQRMLEEVRRLAKEIGYEDLSTDGIHLN